MPTKTIDTIVEESRAMFVDEVFSLEMTEEYPQSAISRIPVSSTVDHPELEIICAVARRSLKYRYRNVYPEFIHDSVQEAACRFYEQGGLRSEVNSRTVYAWILTAATRELGHILRNECRFVLFSGVQEHPRASIFNAIQEIGRDDDVPTGDGPSDQLADIMTYHSLLGKLSHNLAEAVQLHADGYTADEIAEHVGCTRAAAYKRVQRGCTELRQLWQDEECRVQMLVSTMSRT